MCTMDWYWALLSYLLVGPRNPRGFFVKSAAFAWLGCDTRRSYQQKQLRSVRCGAVDAASRRSPHDGASGNFLRYRLWPDAESFLTMPQSVVWTISTSVLALRKTSPGTEPIHLSLRVPSPTLPTTNRSALTSSARWDSA